MMTEQDEPYYVKYDGDFGLSGLAAVLSAMTPSPSDAEAVVELASRTAAGETSEEYGDPQIGQDARCLLNSSLAEDTIRTLWLAATRGRFDPADHGMDTRSWLRRISDVCPPPKSKASGKYTKYLSTIPSWPASPKPVEEEIREAVLAEVRVIAPELTRVIPLPDLVLALRQAVTQAGADLGFRLLLRALKAYSVRIEKEQYDRFLVLGEKFGHHTAVAQDGLDVAWPPIDTARLEATGDFGFSDLTSRFAHWYDHTVREVLWMAATADEPHQPPGSAAAVLLEDTLRLLDSPLSTHTITTLWVAASNGGYSIDHLGIDGRHWLGEIIDVCRERLREVAPDYEPVLLPAPSDLADAVLRELREVSGALGDRIVRPYGREIIGTAVVEALEQVVSRVDSDLGYRLFLHLLNELSVPLTQEQYERYEAIGRRFGYGEYHVSQVDYLVSHD